MANVKFTDCLWIIKWFKTTVTKLMLDKIKIAF